MTATEIMAIQAKQGGYKIKNSWDGTWANFTEADVQADCKDAQDPEKCMAALRQSSSYEGGSSNSGQWKQVGLGLLSSLFGAVSNRNTGIYGGAQYDAIAMQRMEEERRRRNRNTMLILGAVVVAAGIGIYMYTKKK